MSEQAIPPAVLSLIASSIDSVSEMEALLLFREESSRNWTQQQLAARLYITEREAAEVLQNLKKRKLISEGSAPSQEFVYQPGELVEAVDQLAVVHRTRLIAITKLIHSKPTSLSHFADAFRLRKEP